jgi:acyl carrier protein
MDKLTKIISEALQISADKITPTTAIHETPAWNSLTHIELIIMIEEAFNLQFQEDDIVEMRSVGAIRDILAKRGVLLDK